jgi:hypothetical protein
MPGCCNTGSITCSCPHGRQVPSPPPFSSSSTSYAQAPRTCTPLATTTLKRDVTQRARRTEVQSVTRSHEAATLTDVHAGMHTAATHATTLDNATHTKDAARQAHETPTQAQAASHDASTGADTHSLATTSRIRHAQTSLSQLHSQCCHELPSPCRLVSSIFAPSCDPTTCAHKSSMQQEGHNDMTRPCANSTNLHTMDFDDKTSAHAVKRTLQAKGRATQENVMQMNVATLST